jgi:two-component system sensor histidine kinase MprB
MRTPLTSLTANLDLLDRFERLPSEDRPEVLAAVRSDVEDLTALMTELVELAADRTSDEAVVTVDLGDLADAVATRARRRTGRTIMVITDGLAEVPGRPVMLERALDNLVNNAHKYSPTDTPIEIVVAGPSIRVVDHGPGIAPAEQALAFERFWRADTARNRPGSGLGLAIVHQIVTRHRGTVTIEETPGGGATLIVDLPTKA